MNPLVGALIAVLVFAALVRGMFSSVGTAWNSTVKDPVRALKISAVILLGAASVVAIFYFGIPRS